MVPAGEGFGLPKEPAGEPMKPFDLPKRGALTANEDPTPGHAAGGAANDLRSYLQRSVVLRSRALAEASRRSEPIATVASNGKAAPTLNSIEDVLAHLRGQAAEEGPRAVLVAAARAGVDATNEALRIAQAQSAEQRLCVLLDLGGGPTTLCARLGLLRSPGFAELAAGHAGFEDVIQVDKGSPLQVIVTGQVAGSPQSQPNRERLVRIFEALAQVYHFIVLHADRDMALNYQSLLAGRLRAAVAVLAPNEGRNADRVAAELTGLGCAVLVHEQSAERRWLLRRSA